MKKKLFLAGMLSIVLAFGIMVISCDDKDDGNPFEGTWSGTASISGQSAAATITATGSTWNFVCTAATVNESGTYTYSGSTATLKSGTTTLGTATISGKNLSVSLIAGSYSGATGTFSK
ncbi:MAG: hypothetical protein LBB48_07290 [Treponema sp.]|jgi:uncharacterized lipoprotein YehR (DUF1307 family)|nr:hypothetical protein [Treponema sp.]